MLSIRRFVAFAIDLVLIIALTVVLLAVLRPMGITTSGTTLFLFVAATLVLLEAIRYQTPGKLVTGIALARTDCTKIGAYEIVLRMIVIALTLAAASLLLDLCRTYDVSPVRFAVMGAFVDIFVISLWPISILFGRGRMGLHDLIARTQVTDRDTCDSVPVSSSFLPATVVSAAVIAVIVTAAITGLGDKTTRPMKADPEYLSTHMRLAEVLNGIQRHEELVLGYGMRPHHWSADDIANFTFHDNVEGIGDTLSFDASSFQAVVDCEIQTSVEGLLSVDFQRAVVRRLSTLIGPGVMLNVNFTVTESVGPSHVALGKRLVAFAFVVAGQNQPLFMSLEPDRQLIIEAGFVVVGVAPRLVD